MARQNAAGHNHCVCGIDGACSTALVKGKIAAWIAQIGPLSGTMAHRRSRACGKP